MRLRLQEEVSVEVTDQGNEAYARRGSWVSSGDGEKHKM